VASFERSLLFEGDRGFLAIVEPGIANGPLNGVLARAPERGWTTAVAATGTWLNIRNRCIIGGGAEFDAAGAGLWDASRRFAGISLAASASLAAHDTIARLLGEVAGTDGMASVVLGRTVASSSPVARLTVEAVAGLRTVLEQLCGGRAHCDGAPGQHALAILGLGPGLTPAGDDVVVGVLVTLGCFGPRAAAEALARSVDAAASQRTSRFSAALLRWAGCGLAGEPLMQLMDAIAGGSDNELAAAVRAASAVGHSSGADAVAGVLIALSLLAEQRH